MPQLDDTPALTPGTRLGAWRIERMVGEGGMGRVYIAEHEHIGRRVALKLLRKDLARHQNAVDRFFVEAQVVNRIRHPGIVEVTDLFVADGMPCIVMELLEGQTLAQRLHKGPLPAAEAIAIVTQIAEALQAAHAHDVVHRDLKPDNVMLVRDDEGGLRVKVLDFGVAKLTAPQTLMTAAPRTTAAGVIVGTPEYMAPEQLTARAVDARTDVYALGVLFFEVLSGTRPFHGGGFGDLVVQHLTVPPPPLPPALQLPIAIEELVLDMLEKDANKRPASMSVVIERLRGAAADLVKDAEFDAAVRSLHPLRRRSTIFGITAASAAAVVAAFAVAAAVATPPTLASPAPTTPTALTSAARAPLPQKQPAPHEEPLLTSSARPTLQAPAATATTTPAKKKPQKKRATLARRGVLDPFAGQP